MSNVFIPTNPHDKILTDAERQKWESDLDNKKDDFPYIALTKAQLKLLKQARTDAVLITAHNENDAAGIQRWAVKKCPAQCCSIERDGGTNLRLRYVSCGYFSTGERKRQ